MFTHRWQRTCISLLLSLLVIGTVLKFIRIKILNSISFQICFGCAFLDRFSGSNSNISQTQAETIGIQAEAVTMLARRGNKEEEIEVELVDPCALHTVHVTANNGSAGLKDTQNTTSLWTTILTLCTNPYVVLLPKYCHTKQKTHISRSIPTVFVDGLMYYSCIPFWCLDVFSKKNTHIAKSIMYFCKYSVFGYIALL